MINVLIESEAGSKQGNEYDQQTGKHRRSFTVAAPYPFPYGCIVGTRSEDGEGLDCYILTSQPLRSGTQVEAEPIGMIEFTEDGKADHKILAALPTENVELDEHLQITFREYTKKFFSKTPDKRYSVGKFLGPNEALALIKKYSTHA